MRQRDLLVSKICFQWVNVVPLQHGFQSMLYLLLPPGALLYEVFPHRYYKHGYKRAALEWRGCTS